MRESFLNFEGKTVVVTGGAKGIGRAIAERFTQFGAKTVIADLDPQGADVAARLGNAGRKAGFYACDLTDASQIHSLVEAVERDYGGIDVLVNNAGIFPRAEFQSMSEAFWDNVLTVNVKAPMLLCQAAVPGMIRRGGGNIVNIGSLHSRAGEAKTLAYAVSKAGVNTLTRNLARQLSQHRIRVNCVRPGWIASDGEVARWKAEGLDPETIRLRADRQPLGRMQTGDDIACAVAFLASELASQVTGQILTVDGGLSLG